MNQSEKNILFIIAGHLIPGAKSYMLPVISKQFKPL